MVTPPNLKPVLWIGGTKDDLSALHEDLRDAVGQALFEAQRGGRHRIAKPLRGFGDARSDSDLIDARLKRLREHLAESVKPQKRQNQDE